MKKKLKNNLTYFGLLLPLVFSFMIVGCTNQSDEDMPVVIEPEETEIACRISKLKVDGQLQTEYIYNSENVGIRENYYENGEITAYVSYSYNSEGRVELIDIFNANDEKERFYKLFHNADGFVIERERWRIVEGNEEQMYSRQVYIYNDDPNCSTKEAHFFGEDGSLMEKTEYVFTDANCSYVSNRYFEDSGELIFTFTMTYDDKKSIYESVASNFGRTLHNPVERKYEFANGAIDNEIIELEYNEFDYPIQAVITDENGDTQTKEYEYICE